MIVGVPKEIKPQEHRVALTPGGAAMLTAKGHTVLIQQGAGARCGFPDTEYAAAGAELLPSAKEIFAQAGLIVKVKEPLPPELPLLRADQILFTYLHLAPNPELAEALCRSGCAALAYETVALPDGTLPLLAPMSAVAGRLAVLVGTNALSIHQGGRGVLLSGIPGVLPGRVVIVGGGTVGRNAAQVAVGLGADVVLMDIRDETLAHLELVFGGRLKTLHSTAHALAEEVRHADLVIGAVYVTGARAPRLITREMVRSMRPGSVIVDVAIDQGGCCETSHPTTHAEPTFIEEGVVHYCVANMPGAMARTSTQGLTNATLPYVARLAERGLGALGDDPALALGLNIAGGSIRHPSVAEALSRPHVPFAA